MHVRRRLLPLFLLFPFLTCLVGTAQVTRQTTVVTRAGTGTAGYAAVEDGSAATAAQLNGPQGVVTDLLGNVYVADTANHRVRKIDGRTGLITTIAGNGTAGYRAADENVVATFGELNAPQDLALDGLGNLYIADTGNHRIRKVVLSTNIMTTAAGNGATTYNQQELGNAVAMAISKPTGIAVDPFNNLYIADADLNRVFYAALTIANNGVQQGKIKTFAGNGTAAYTTSAAEENVNATVAHLSGPLSVAVDRYQIVYIADSGNARIRKVDTNKIVTIAGDGTAYTSASEGATATAAGIGPVASVRNDIVRNLYFSLSTGHRVLKLSVVTGKLGTYAGTGSAGFADQTVPASAAFSTPVGLALDAAGTLFIADSGNNRLRAIPVATGNLLFPKTTVGNSDTTQSFVLTADAATTLTSVTVITPSGTTPEFAVGTPTGCAAGSALAAGAVCSIPITFTPGKPGRRMAPIEVVTSAGTQRFGLSGVGIGPLVIYSPNVTTPFAGSTTGSYTAAEDNGPATAGHFLTLSYLAVDSADNILIADARGSRIRKVSTSGIVTTLAGNGLQVYAPADEGALATNVGLASPSDVAADAAGNIYIADASNGRIRKIDAVSKKITTIAGNGNTSGNGSDSILATSGPVGGGFPLTLDQQGDLYYTDSRGGTRRVDAATGYVNAIVSNFANLTGALNCNACQGRPVVDEFGTLYLAGTSLYRANQMVGTVGTVGATTNPGTGAYAVSLDPNGDLLLDTGTGNLAQYNILTDTFSTVATYTSPSTGFILDSSGNAIYQTVAGYQLVKVNSQSAKLAFSGTTVVGSQSSDSPKTFTLFNVGSAPFTLQSPSAGLNPAITSDFQLNSSSTCPQLSTLSPSANIAAATGCKYGINFIPVAPGPVVGQAVFTDNQFGSPTPVTQSVVLTGTASGTAVTTSLGLTGLANTIAGTAQTVTVTAYSGSDQTHIATNYTGTVTFTSTDTNSGVLPAPYTFTAADAGVHTFTITLKLADKIRVTVTDNSNTTLTASATATVSAAKAVTIAALLGTPQSVATNAVFTTSLTSVVKDTYGNGVPGITVTFGFPATGASATVFSTTEVTDDLGQAHVLPTANAVTGSYNVTATATGVSSPAYFQITNTAPIYGFTIAATSTALTYGPDVGLSAHISPNSSNGHDPTGTVTIYEGSTVLASGPVPAGHADFSFLVPAPSVGTHTYSAGYTGDSVYPAAAPSSATVVVTVTKGGSLVQAPFTPTIERPGSFVVTVENDHGADSSTKAYIRPSGVVTYTIDSVCGSGTGLTGSLTLVNGAANFPIPADCAARVYNITYAYAGDSNYNAATNQQHTSLTVTAPTATISITNLDQNYDGLPKPVTVTTTPAGLAYSISYAGSPSGVPTLAGMYPVTVRITDPNYTASATATLIIRKGPVAIYWPQLDPIVYGTPLSTTQLSATTTVPGVFSFNPIAGTILTPGSYLLSVSFTPNDSPSTPTTATQSLTVTKAALTVKAVDAGRVYADANPTFSATILGAVNGDTFTTGGTTTATTTSPVGAYPIVPSVAGTNLGFYNVTYVNGTLTVSGAPATITLSNLNQTSDGSPKAATVTTVPAGLATSVTYNGSATPPSLPGSYSVVATIADANYTGTANGVLVITAGVATITWNTPAAIAYGTPLGATQLNATASLPGTFVYTPAAGTVLLPGTQTLNAVFTPTGGGTTTSANVSLVVNKGSLTVTAVNAARMFGVANPPLTASVAGTVNGDVLSASATTAATPASPIGTYAIVPAVSGTNVAAYNVTLVNGTLTIASAASTVSLVSSKPTTYVGDTVTFTATVTGAGGTPTGSVEFFNGATSLGVKTLASGAATVSTSTLPAGTYSITAKYAGDASYSPATSAVVVETIFTSDYSIVVNPTTLTIKRGQSGTATFTVTPTGNFHDTITFACNTLPANTTCTFAPPTLTPNGAPVSTTLTINTAATTARLEKTFPWQRSGSGIALAAMIGLFAFRRRRGLPALVLLITLGLGGLATLTGCAAVAPSIPTTPAGTYPISISAGVSTGGSGAHSVNLTVNVVD